MLRNALKNDRSLQKYLRSHCPERKSEAKKLKRKKKKKRMDFSEQEELKVSDKKNKTR